MQYFQTEKGKARAKRYREKNKNKAKAQNRALWIHKETQLCSIRGCSQKGLRHHPDYKKPEEIIWLCRKHHLMIHGKVRGKCSLCDNPHSGKGLCKKHYAQKFRKEQGW